MASFEWIYPGSTLTRVVDGDTFLATLTRDVGFHLVLTWQQRFRLNRINCPPASTDAGKAATAAAVALLTGVPLTIDSVGPYKYGDEWMAEVTIGTAPDLVNVSDALVNSGNALYWDGQGPRPGG